MRSKRFLALTLALCMTCPGAAPAWASAEESGPVGQRGELQTETEERVRLTEGEFSETMILENEENASLISNEPEPETPAEEASGGESLPVGEMTESGNQTNVSGNGNQTVSNDVLDEECWDLVNPPYYKLKKSRGSSEYFTAADGIVQLHKNDGGDAYYVFDGNGIMQTGVYAPSGSGAQTYYFLTKEDVKEVAVPNPRNSRLGQMLTSEGWIQAGDRWLYLKEGGAWDTSKVGLQKLPDGKIYSLSETGVIEKGVLRSVGDSAYYFGEQDGVMVTNSEKTLNGVTYYFGGDGAMVTNAFQKVGDKQYYFDEQGKRLEETGWQKLNDSWYYFDEDHSRVVKTKWQKITEDEVDEYYYFDEDGRMAKDQFIEADDYMYRVDSTGRRVTGLVKIDDAYYYFRPAKEGDAPIGSAYKGWIKINGSWYRFAKNYQAETRSLVTINSKYYSFSQNGKMYKGGLKEIDGKYYYFEKQTENSRKGYAATKKWIKKSGEWYYATAKGFLKTNGWAKKKGNYYYFGEDAAMVKNTWMQRNGKWGYLKGNGVFSQNWVKIQGEWKYAKKDGTFAKGWTNVKQNGVKYRFYFNKKGVWVQDLRKRVSGPYMLKVDRTRNQITVYAKGTNGKYNTPVVAFPCSVGLPATPTPVGTFIGTRAGRWQELMGPSWGQYATLVDASNGIFIHSVAGSAPNINSLPYGEWNKLGRSAASHGCIRVAVADAKWIYQNCNGATVEVRDYANAGPFTPKKYPKITSAYKWDPTDPEGRGYL